MMTTVCVKSFPSPPLDLSEIRRYAGMRGEEAETEAILRSCLREAEDQLVYKVCYREFAVSKQGNELDLGFVRTASADLARNLEGCDSVLLFAATVGLGIDRLIARYAAVSPTRSLFFQAIGAERIESLCGAFVRYLSTQKADGGTSLRPRFSPGYGDLPLQLQADIFAALDCPRKIGLFLNQSLLMSPTKSVTALVGLTNNATTKKDQSL